MFVIIWKSSGAGREASLCAGCVWGTVRKGYRSESEGKGASDRDPA